MFCLQVVGVELEQLEGAPLEVVALGELVEADVGAAKADAVAGEGGERVEQVAEAGDGQAVGGCLARRFFFALGDRWAGATGSAGASGLSSVKSSGARRCSSSKRIA